MTRPVAPVAFLLLAAFLLSGCAGDPGVKTLSGVDAVPEVEATSTTGGIRGVIVDDRITPIAGAFVEVVGAGKNMTTGPDGLFVFSGLEPGSYTVKATHVLYAGAQSTADVVAGESEPRAVKIQLLRTVFASPYIDVLSYEGFVVCSVNLVVVLSEECGEGVGVPCEVPVVGCTRQGGQGNNNVQFDFTVGAGARSIVVEKVWEPTSEAGKALYSPISTEWSCLPSCGGNQLASMDGESPLYALIDNATIDSNEIVPDQTVISVFTWASPSYTGAITNQQYKDFVTVFYHVPAPEGWSFVQGSPNPFV